MTSKFRNNAPTLALILGTMLALVCFTGFEPLLAKGPADAPPIPLAQLPQEAQTTLKLIANGGPFPHARDGVIFGNYEKLLPMHARGYYHEYTVPTLGMRTRGARRIICGGVKSSIAECYYSDDHYQSFRKIVS